MTEYLLELYVARADAVAIDQDTERARLAAEEHTREGTPVRYLRSIFVPDDETCLCLYDAVSMEAVREMSARAGLELERISVAIASGSAGEVEV